MRRLTKDERLLKVKKCLEQSNQTFISGDVTTNGTINVCCFCGKLFSIKYKQLLNLERNHKTIDCGEHITRTKWTREKILDFLVQNNKEFTLLTTHQNFPSQPSVQKLRWKCNIDSHEWEATFDSIKTMKSGCPTCAAKGKPLKHDKDTIAAKLKQQNRTDLCIISLEEKRRVNASNRPVGKYGMFKCANCNYTWNALIHNVIKFKYGCPICNTNMSIPCTSFDGERFHSKLERYFWEKYCGLYPLNQLTVQRQVKYIKSRRYTCDFMFSDLKVIVEICGTALLKHQSYKDTIEIKNQLAINLNYKFIILTNIPDINQFFLTTLPEIICKSTFQPK